MKLLYCTYQLNQVHGWGVGGGYCHYVIIGFCKGMVMIVHNAIISTNDDQDLQWIK